MIYKNIEEETGTENTKERDSSWEIAVIIYDRVNTKRQHWLWSRCKIY